MSKGTPMRAFPTVGSSADCIPPQGGMSLRDYFAAKAMQGILSNISWNQLSLAAAGVSEKESFDVLGKLSYIYADSVLKHSQE